MPVLQLCAFHIHCSARWDWKQPCSTRTSPPKLINELCFSLGLMSWVESQLLVCQGTSCCANSTGLPGIPENLIRYSLVRHRIKKERKNRFADPLGQMGAGNCCFALGLICLCSLATFRLASGEKDEAGIPCASSSLVLFNSTQVMRYSASGTESL